MLIMPKPLESTPPSPHDRFVREPHVKPASPRVIFLVWLFMFLFGMGFWITIAYFLSCL